MQQNPEDPRDHAMHIRGMLNDVLEHCREDVTLVAEPKAQALFETTAEVLGGLKTAYEHYLTAAEPAMTPLTPPSKPTTVNDGEAG
ncbi:MAG TPA: hypothetical protein VEI97_02225 [bacterium]|nr:hypothetical protein [bacterium]